MVNKQKTIKDILARAKKIRLLLMDCDGVLTDGKLYFSAKGEELKVFNIHDGQGIVSWHQAGFRSGIISGRDLRIVKKRATELGIHYIKSRSFDKAKDFEVILKDAKVSSDEVAFVGDDIGDICLLKKVGLPIVVADAAQEVVPYALYKTESKGGFGAVREVTNLLLTSKNMNNSK